MADIVLFDGFILPAEQGPYGVKVYPPQALEATLKAYAYRSSGGWLEYSHDPEKAIRRVATIRRKAMFRPNKRLARIGPVEKKEGILQRNNGGRRN